jgi:hypothetical protein
MAHLGRVCPKANVSSESLTLKMTVRCRIHIVVYPD